MEISWRWLSFYCGLLICSLCNAHPSNLEGIVADQQTQFLTGLLGVLLIVCSLIFLAGCLCCQKRNNFKAFRNSPVVASVPSDLDHGHVNPIANGEFTIFTPLSPPIINNNVFLPREQIVTSKLESYIHEGTDLSHWFDEAEKDFPRIRLKYVKELGRGKFGKVVEGAAQGVFASEEDWTPVVVRILDSTSNHEEKLLFLKDALIYRCDPHPNVLSLYGKCLDTIPFLLLQEYCQDDLKSHLRSSIYDKNILFSKYLLWSTQLISALKHLHHFNFIHQDIACRNCLLTADLNLKLGDYSLSPTKFPSDYYRGVTLVPIRWCDPESVEYINDSIQLKKLTPSNNIWSLGVTLWEICQGGEQPYANLNDAEVISAVLRSNLRLQKPIHSAPYMDNLYFVIQSCWNSIESRPNIIQIDSVLSDILEVHVTQASDTSSFSSDDFDKKWELLKPNSMVKNDHRADSISIEMTDNDIRILNPLSPSKGSLNNLLVEKCEPRVDFQFKNERTRGGLGGHPDILEDVMCHSDSSDQGSIKVETSFSFNDNCNNDVRNFVYQRTSSGSETEDENWRKKVERGAYTEKVRMKSRSVADLMILTHVDYSESESETPLPSLDFKINYKNVRSNLDNSHTFGSEGNLLSIQDTFQEELRKLQEERKDSLLFVPDMSSKSSPSKNSELEKDSAIRDVNTLANSTKLLRELSSPERIQPSSQVYNVFNVSVENHSPIYKNSKLQGIINLNSPFKFETEVTEAKINEPNKTSEDLKVTRPYESFSCDNVKKCSNKPIVNVECDQLSIASLDNVLEKEQINQGQIKIENGFINNINNSESDKRHCQNNIYEEEEVVKDDINCDKTSPKIITSTVFKETANLSPISTSDIDYIIDIQDSIQKNNCTIEIIDKPFEPLTSINNGTYLSKDHSSEQNFNQNSENMLIDFIGNTHNKIVNSDEELCSNKEKNELSNITVASDNKISNKCDIIKQLTSNQNEGDNHVELNTDNIPEQVLTDENETNHNSDSEIQDILKIVPVDTSERSPFSKTENKSNIKFDSTLPASSPDVILSHQEFKNDLVYGNGSTENDNILPNHLDQVSNDESRDLTKNSPDIILSCKESVQELEKDGEVDNIEDSNIKYIEDLTDKTKNSPENCKIMESSEIYQVKDNTENLNEMCLTNAEQSNYLISPDDQSSYEFLSCEANLDNELCNTSESLYSILDHTEFDQVRSDKDSMLETCDEGNLKINVDNETRLELDNVESCHDAFPKIEELDHAMINDIEVDQPVTRENLEINQLLYETNEALEDVSKQDDYRNQLLSSNNTHILNETSDKFEVTVDNEKELGDPEHKVKFDLSADQEEAMPNSLTHSCAFSSTPMRKTMPVSIEDTYSSINLFNIPVEDEKNDHFSSDFAPVQETNRHNENLSYSLETWDNFLNKTLNNQSRENLFDSFSSEPKSLLFIENEDIKSSDMQDVQKENGQQMQLQESLVLDPENVEEMVEPQGDLNSTFTKENPDVLVLEDSHDSSWESGDGWFVHPQNEEVSGEMQISSSSSDSYVGFGIDDEIMSAIRNELLSKLPHAQGSNVDRMKDESLLDSQETNEVFLRYNVYNTPLSPIPEESFAEDGSESNTPKQTVEDEDSDWSDRFEGPQDTESHSTRTLEGISRGPLHRHTPSQDSCCSNDTLFNLEELNFAAGDIEKDNEEESDLKEEESDLKEAESVCEQNDLLNTTYVVETENKINEDLKNSPTVEEGSDTQVLNSNSIKPETLDCLQSLKDFLVNERQHSSNDTGKSGKVIECISDEPKDISEQENFIYNKAQVVPLPSPENNPWKQLPLSLSFNIMPQSGDSPDTTNGPEYVNSVVNECDNHVYENNLIQNNLKDLNPEPEYVNCDGKTSPQLDKDYNNYVNLVNMENAKNSLESTDSEKDYVNIENFDNETTNEENIFGILTDIRFNGPTDSQLMSTSFSESNNDEQEWDSGSDSRSSSSGEFIWKLEEIKPMDKIAEDQFEESDVSSFSDDDGETPEFIPSAWDKFAMPSKSALRSPEKTLNKSGDKKAKVWFKKQKYHCIYEYPKEPESPILQSQDLWKAQTDFKVYTDWEFDGEPYSVLTEDPDAQLDFQYKSNNVSNNRSLYQLTDVSEFMPGNTGLDEEFFISSSSQPFNAGSSSQFFPGSSKWGIENTISGSIENATPDSGVEDITPGSQTDSNEYMKIERSIPTLKQLASACVSKNKQSNIKNEDVLGGLRHTRNKLKLDLPPSPSAFSNDKVFVVENNPEPVIREKPSFTTFGKSRFLVQHIDTPEDETQGRNVSFEALPYKPLANTSKKESQELQKNNDLNLSSSVTKKDLNGDESNVKLKIEIVRGEASLLDSADEDSGIESSTLERKLSNV